MIWTSSLVPCRIVGEAVTDARLAAPPGDVAGEVPAEAAVVAEQVFAEFGLPGLVLAGSREPPILRRP